MNRLSIIALAVASAPVACGGGGSDTQEKTVPAYTTRLQVQLGSSRLPLDGFTASASAVPLSE